MTDHTSLIELVRQPNEERDAANRVYRAETQRISMRLADRRREQLERAKASGHLVTVGLDSVARRLDMPLMDIQHDYGRNLPCWDGMTQWMLLNCQGSTMLFEPVDSGDDGADSSAQTHTFLPTNKSTLKGSYRTKISHRHPLNPGILPLDIMQEVSHPVDLAMNKSNTISAWFELSEDAVLFKLTFA